MELRKWLDPSIKPDNQSKSKKVLLKPSVGTPSPSPRNRPTGATTPVTPSPRGTPRTPLRPTPQVSRSLLNTPSRSPATRAGTPTTTPQRNSPAKPCTGQNVGYQQTPTRNQLISKTNTSLAQALSRKLIQKSVKLLNTRQEFQPQTPAQTPSALASFPGQEDNDSPSIPSNVAPLALPKDLTPKLPPQQALLPQDNPFDTNSDLILFQEREV